MPVRCFVSFLVAAFLALVGNCWAQEPIGRAAPAPAYWQTGELPERRLRSGDQIEFIFRLAPEEPAPDYRLEAGDVIRIESLVDASLNRELTVQSDGTIDLLLLGPVRVIHQSAPEVQRELNERYKKYYKLTDIHVARVKTHSRAAALLNAVGSDAGGYGKLVRVTPEGTVALPAIGAVPVQGVTLAEISREVTERYRLLAAGLEVTAILARPAPEFVFVIGDVRHPGRFELTGPTSLLQSLALAGGWNGPGLPGEAVILRPAEDGSRLATRIALGDVLCTAGSLAAEYCVGDGDVVVFASPKHARCAGHLLKLCAPSKPIWSWPAGCSDALHGSSTLTALPSTLK